MSRPTVVSSTGIRHAMRIRAVASATWTFCGLKMDDDPGAFGPMSQSVTCESCKRCLVGWSADEWRR